ncbi:hypothetical protein RJG79_00175 [Mycoplasmatota bacterium WC44]
MKIVDDYKYWIEAKKDFLEEMKKTESLIYDRLSAIILTLEHLAKKEEFDEDEGYIFNVGFMYLYEQINNIESYIASSFKSFEALDENSVVFNYLCELEDFKTDYTSMEESDSENIQDYIDQVESALLARESISNLLYEEIDAIMVDLTEEYGEYLPISEIYRQIGENLKVV